MSRSNPSTDVLGAIRLALASVVVVVMLPAINMPAGYMGARDELTNFGAIYSGILGLVTLAAVVGILRRFSWGEHLTSLILTVNVGLFVPALAADPVAAGLVLFWQLIALASHLGGRLLGVSYDPLPTDLERGEQVERWYRRWGGPGGHALVAGVILVVAVVGYGVSDRWTAFAITLLVNLLALAGAGPFLYAVARSGNWLVGLVVLPVVGWVVTGLTLPGLLVAVGSSGAIVFVFLLVRSPLFEEALDFFFDFPALLVFISFGGVILLGSLLLTLPIASTAPGSISPIDALFTSTSATCVTGLIVLDTPHDFTQFGQLVILGLIQVGGLGIMVVSTFGAILVGQGIGLRGEQALGDLMNIRGSRDAYRLTRFIVGTTLAVEALGVVGLTAGYMRHGFELAEAAYLGLFHAISAFCNAGFALQSDSLVQFQNDPLILTVVMVLIVLGGIGFVVMATVWAWMTSSRRPAFDVQSRIILSMTGLLVVAAAILYGVSEWSATLGGMSTPARLGNALFQSVTLRTAGFNSVDFGALQSSTLVIMMVWMFIGASPGSTAGGIKSTTVAVLLGAVRSIASGKTHVVLFGRRIPQPIVYRSAAIAAVATFFVIGGVFVLLAVEPLSFESALFEVVSAVGTVGLSIGATGELHAAGKLTITILMFVGRIGPLTVALLLGAEESASVNYPTEEIMVG